MKKLTGQKGQEGQKNKLVILGTASTLKCTPWGSPNTDFWGCAPIITQPLAKPHIEKISMLFEFHPMEYWIKIVDRLNGCGIPVYMQKKVPQIAKSLTFPLHEIQDMVNKHCDRLQRYFTSTISFMIGLAILKNYKKIELYGVHMSSDEEYGEQRQACEAWIAYAAGRGIKIFIPEQSDIMRCPTLYGYEQQNSVVIQARHKRFASEKGLQQLKEKLENAKRMVSEQTGAINMLKRMEKEYS